MKDASNRPDEVFSRLADLEAEPTQSAEDSTILELRRELDGLISELQQPPSADPFEAEPACQSATPSAQALNSKAGSELPLGKLGQYELLEKLGEGGMGAV